MMFDEYGNLVGDWRDVGYINTTSASIQETKEMEGKQMGSDCSSVTFEAKIRDCYVPMGNLCTLEEITTAWCRSFIIDKFTPNRILRSGPATIVFWADGTKTVVKRAPDEEDNAYAAFTAALAIKIFGSNSKLKKIVKTKTEEQK